MRLAAGVAVAGALVLAPEWGGAAPVRPDIGPLTAVTHVDILPENAETGGALLAAEAKASRADAGCVEYRVLRQRGASNHFTVVATWRGREALDRHAGTPHTRTFRAMIQPLLASPFDERVHDPVPEP